MLRAVNGRLFRVLGLEGDDDPYPFCDYGNGEGCPQTPGCGY